MKFTRVLASAVAVLVLAVVAASAVAEEKKEGKKGGEKQMCRCPMCSMAEASRDEEKAAAGEAAERLKKMGMSDAMMKRCHIMVKARVESADPAAILALKNELELSEQQVKKLEKIAEKARDRAKALLTETQQKKLEELPDKPDCSEDMQCKMVDMVRKESGDQKKEQRDEGEERQEAEEAKSNGHEPKEGEKERE
jgi:hypothetical protein